ncbi:MAG TPA: SdpI family protein [Tepidisphaeraceae bacterium]|nr:SdpI family protein [Tepidisphaeraceae bacterium]
MWASWVFGVLGILIVGFGIPLARGKVAPNRLYGFRTRKTLSDPAIWYPANRFAGRGLIAAGIVIAFACAVMPHLTGGRFVATMLGDEAVLLGSILVAVVYSFLQLRKL